MAIHRPPSPPPARGRSALHSDGVVRPRRVGARARAAWAALCAVALAGCGGQSADDIVPGAAEGAAGLIPRAELFDGPDKWLGRFSPDGRFVSWVASGDDGFSLWIAPAAKPDYAKQLVPGGVAFQPYQWAPNNTHIIFYRENETGNGKRPHVIDLATHTVADITPGPPDASGHLQAWSWDHPDEIVIAANDRDREARDLHRVNLATGESERVMENVEGFLSYHLDRRLMVRLAESAAPEGGRVLHLRTHAGAWRELLRIPREDAMATRIIGFDATNQAVIAFDSRGRDAAALVRLDLGTGEATPIVEAPGVDLADLLVHPTTFEPDAVHAVRLDDLWIALNARAEMALANLENTVDGDVWVIGRTVDDTRWMVFEMSATNPGLYHVYDVVNDEITQTFVTYPELAGRALAPTTPVVIRTPDGLELISYLTLPAEADEDGDGAPERTSPMVIMPSGQYRAYPGFSASVQWLADRGYAVLTVTVRGAGGLGKAFRANAADAVDPAIVQDVVTAAEWAVRKGVADPDRIAVAGVGADGLTVFAALDARAPFRFACGAALDTPSDLPALLEAAPDMAERLRWAPPPADETGERADWPPSAAATRSPRAYAEHIAAPFVYGLGSGGHPAQVDGARALAEAARANGVEATLVIYPGEFGTLSGAPAELDAYFAAVERTFAACLGGPAEPYLAPDPPRDVEIDASPGFTASLTGAEL